MDNIYRISLAMHYIDDHINENLTFKHVADIFYFSPYYFHRLFSAVAGKTITAYIRDRRLEKACEMLVNTERSVTSICFDCGFDSSQAFNRIFKGAMGVTPGDYRKLGYVPAVISVEEMVEQFTNRLKGGIFVYPKLIEKERFLIAGITGDGNMTGELWQNFMELNKEIGLSNKLSDNGFEIRIYDGSGCKCHVGLSVADSNVDGSFSLLQLPASEYASFDVYVAKGYDSENSAMDQWLRDNSETYEQGMYDGSPFVVEFYDERFHGDNSDSIVEIWVPVKKIRCADGDQSM